MPGTIATVMREGFRVFFLAGALYAVLAMALWLVWLWAQTVGGPSPAAPFAPAPHHWHAHEMIFGYSAAVLGGFFLTAVPSWTGTAAARTGFLTLAALAWLTGRIAVWVSGALDPVLVAVLDLAFLPLLGLRIAWQLARRPKPQNVMLLGLLAVIWSGNLLVHLEWTGAIADGAGRGLRTGLLGIAALIAVIGGRVAPAFTRNAMTRAGREHGLPVSRRPLELLGIGSAILLPLLVLLDASEPALAAVALLSAGVQLSRLSGWRPGWAAHDPLLWSLHLGFALLGLGYGAVGLGWAGIVGEVAGLHLLGIGAVGVMTLAVMSRASLGHTGRPLVAPRAAVAAFVAMALAALLRLAAPLGDAGWYGAAMLGSGGLWMIAFGLFLAAFWKPLTTPRPGACVNR